MNTDPRTPFSVFFRYGERFVDEDLEEMMKNADLDRLVR